MRGAVSVWLGLVLTTAVSLPACSLVPWDDYQYNPTNACSSLARCCPASRRSACEAAEKEGLDECGKLLDTIRSQSDCRD